VRPLFRSRWRSSIAVLVLVAAIVAPVSARQSSTAQGRLLAIGDIHGSYDGLTAILKKSALVDDQLKWIGGRATVVQTGDYTDRGADVKKVMDLLMRLEREARSAGGQFIVLAGNHEVMNLVGDLRDVTPEICAPFVTPDSASRLEESWKQYERVARSAARTPQPAVYAKTREAWLAVHPPGCLEYRDAIGPNGHYGRWLRGKDIAAVVNNTLFMHAGLNPSRPAPSSIAEVNDRVRSEVRRLDAFRKRLVDKRLATAYFDLQEYLDAAMSELQAASDAIATAKTEGKELPPLDVPFLRETQEIANLAKWSVVEPEGPLWFRGWASWPEDSTAAQVTAFLDQLKLQRMVVGHTPTADRRIAVRYAGRVFAIDTGMLAPYFMGNASALELTGSSVKAIYPDGEVDLTLPKAAVVVLQ
jgi:Calcineurin-like phosphoesterase